MTEQVILGNGKVIELELIKHDGASASKRNSEARVNVLLKNYCKLLFYRPKTSTKSLMLCCVQSKGKTHVPRSSRSKCVSKTPLLCVYWPVPQQCSCTGLSFVLSSITSCSLFITFFPVLVLRCATSEHFPVQGPQVTVHQPNQSNQSANQQINQPTKPTDRPTNRPTKPSQTRPKPDQNRTEPKLNRPDENQTRPEPERNRRDQPP